MTERARIRSRRGRPRVREIAIEQLERSKREFMESPAFQSLGNAFMNGAAVAFSMAINTLKGKP